MAVTKLLLGQPFLQLMSQFHCSGVPLMDIKNILSAVNNAVGDVFFNSKTDVTFNRKRVQPQ